MLMRQMNYFVRVVECSSFTEAAEQCYISQSAISQQIRALETELGIKLIVRENRKFHLTPAGDYFYWHSKELLSEIEKMKAETKRLADRAAQVRTSITRTTRLICFISATQNMTRWMDTCGNGMPSMRG